MDNTPPHIDLEWFAREDANAPGLPFEENIPELTEVVVPRKPEESRAERSFSAPETRSVSGASGQEAIGAALAKILQNRLRTEIPTLVEATLNVVYPIIAKEIQQGVEEVAQAVIKDFLSGRNSR